MTSIELQQFTTDLRQRLGSRKTFCEIYFFVESITVITTITRPYVTLKFPFSVSEDLVNGGYIVSHFQNSYPANSVSQACGIISAMVVAKSNGLTKFKSL